MALTVSLILAFLLLPPWSPVSLTSDDDSDSAGQVLSKALDSGAVVLPSLTPKPAATEPMDAPPAQPTAASVVKVPAETATPPSSPLDTDASPSPTPQISNGAELSEGDSERLVTSSEEPTEGAAEPTPHASPTPQASNVAGLAEEDSERVVTSSEEPTEGATEPTPHASPTPATAVSTTAEPKPSTEPGEAEPQGISQTIEELIAATDDADWGVRWDAVNALGELRDPKAVPALVRRALYDDNSHPRWRSLWALSAIDQHGNPAIPGLLEGLESTDATVVSNAAVALAFFARPEAIPELLAGLKDVDDFRRWEAVFSLRELPDPEVTQALIPMLQEAHEWDARVRGEAALTLGKLGGEGVAVALLRALQDDSEPAVRWRSAVGLSRLGDISALAGLEGAHSNEQDEQVREFIEEAIEALKPN